MRIGMFDSGVGGLTVLKEFIRRMPNNEYIYFGDTKRLPYGDKSKETLIRYAKEIISFLMNEKVDIIVVACNSLSAVALDEIKDDYNLAIFGVIKPTVDFVKEKGYKKIGVIGTKATINSNVYGNYLKEIDLLGKACPLFVPIIEENINDKEILERIIEYYLKDFKNKNIEAIILGCTHYPIIANSIKDYLSIDIINPAILTAEYVKKQYRYDIKSKPKYTFYFSEINDNVKSLASTILGIKINEFKNHEF